MQPDIRARRKMALRLLFWGLLLTALDILLFISGWWADLLDFWVLFVIGPLLLTASLVLFLVFRSPSSFPEGWENWSREELRDFGIKRAIEASLQGNRAVTFNLWLLRFNPAYRQRIETLMTEKEV